MSKQEQLEALEANIADNASLPLQPANLVFGEGDPDAAVMFIGEAPGFYEDQQQRPFVGRAGKLLDKLIEGIGWKRSDVYITNVVKRRPPENRDPLPEEIEAYKPYLAEQIRIIDPRVIAPLGRFAMNYFLPSAKISQDQGRVFAIKDKLIIPIYHPAAALRSTSVLEATQRTFRILQKAVKEYDTLITKKHTQTKEEQKITDQLI